MVDHGKTAHADLAGSSANYRYIRERTRMNDSNRSNRLLQEKSPYLLQHAHNPVDWFPWGDEAFDRATTEDKPIFLSIGYSTCHWCHVMEKESFEDQEVARLMNGTFISIKVDREERPDLDHIYMTVCQMLTGSGGWPLTILMTPDKKPFFATTYIPKTSRFGRVGMTELIPRISEIWMNRREEVIQSSERILGALESTDAFTPGPPLDEPLLRKAFEEMSKRFDPEKGGFSAAPKFPTPHNLLFMLRFWKRTGERLALQMVEKTLHEMRRGGIYDHIGYGFHRYATDKEWLVPHFEKMLYDQALLSLAYLEAYQATDKSAYALTAKEIFDYVLRDMRASEGAFYSAEDADSEGVEGKFYVWTEKEILDLCGKDLGGLMVKVFNVEKDGNFREESTGEKTGQNIPHLTEELTDLARTLNLALHTLEDRIAEGRRILLAARNDRVRPHKDDKVLTDWNGLMIAALARAGGVLGEGIYSEAARRSADFFMKRMRQPDGRLLHRYRDGEAGITANVDDYAFFIWGLIELYEATFETGYLKWAVQLNEQMLRHFWDDQGGGFYFTPDDGEGLIVRKKEIYDGATPSGNGVAMLNLLRLSGLTGNPILEEKAAAIGRTFSTHITQIPSAYTQFLVSADFAVGPSQEVVIVGERNHPRTMGMVTALHSVYAPNKVVIFKPFDEPSSEIQDLAPFLKDYPGHDGKPMVYVCVSKACRQPTADIDEIIDLLK
jgi:uncharacterized protein YyaL (SSP411 family)